MWRIALGVLLGFVAGWVAQRYVRQFEADDLSEILQDDELAEGTWEAAPGLIEVGQINSLPGLFAATEIPTEVEVAEALSAALAEIETAKSGEEVDLLDDSGMTVERDEDGNLVVTMETDPSPNGNAEDEDEIDFGVVVAEAEPEDNEPFATEDDDLLKLQGIGRASLKLLQNAGLTTFAQIAALTPEELGERTGISIEHIKRYDMIEQARRLTDHQV